MKAKEKRNPIAVVPRAPAKANHAIRAYNPAGA
jgi:hypothetical protein